MSDALSRAKIIIIAAFLFNSPFFSLYFTFLFRFYHLSTRRVSLHFRQIVTGNRRIRRHGVVTANKITNIIREFTLYVIIYGVFFSRFPFVWLDFNFITIAWLQNYVLFLMPMKIIANHICDNIHMWDCIAYGFSLDRNILRTKNPKTVSFFCAHSMASLEWRSPANEPQAQQWQLCQEKSNLSLAN